MADQLCTLAQVKLHADFPAGDVADDTLITELIEEVSDWISEITKRKLVPEPAATYVLDTSSGSKILIPRGIRTVTLLEIATTDQPDTGGTYSSVAAANVLIRPNPINRKPGWPGTEILIRGTSAVLGHTLNGARITGDFGFAVTPPAIVGVTTDAVVAALIARMGASETIGADGTAVAPWTQYFGEGTAQLRTVMRYAVGAGMGIG